MNTNIEIPAYKSESMIKMYKNGFSIDKIHDSYPTISKNEIRKICLNLKPRRRKRKCKKSVNSQRVSIERQKQIWELRNKGLSWKEVDKEVGMIPRTSWYWYKKYEKNYVKKGEKEEINPLQKAMMQQAENPNEILSSICNASIELQSEIEQEVMSKMVLPKEHLGMLIESYNNLLKLLITTTQEAK